MELRHLHYFIAVAEELSFTRASERLHIAQPPLSVQIRQLEEELGTPLLLRSSRKVELTPAGSAFLADSRRILGMADQAMRTAREIGAGRRGTLRLGSVYSAIYAVAPLLLRLFGRHYPDVRVELAEMTVQQQLDALGRGEIDAGILRTPIDDDRVATRLLFREGLVALLPRDHPLAGQDRAALADLAAQPFLLSGIGAQSSFRRHILRLFAGIGREPRILREVAEMHSIISLVGAGLGVSIAPASISRISVEEVVYRPIADPVPPVEVSLAWPVDRQAPALTSLIDLLSGPDLQPVLAGLEKDHG